MPNSVARQRARRNAHRWSAAGLLVLLPLTGCSQAGSDGRSASTTNPVVKGAMSADTLGRVRSLSITRPCGTVGTGPADCVTVTADKIALAAELQPDLSAMPASDITTEAAQVAAGVADLGTQWARLGCQANWVPDCAGVAMAVESKFSALATYIVQLTDGA